MLDIETHSIESLSCRLSQAGYKISNNHLRDEDPMVTRVWWTKVISSIPVVAEEPYTIHTYQEILVVDIPDELQAYVYPASVIRRSQNGFFGMMDALTQGHDDFDKLYYWHD